MIFVDTSAWFAATVPTDPDYAQACRWISDNRQPLVTTDFVVDETVTLLRARGERTRALTLGRQFFGGTIAAVHYLTEAELREAWHVFEAFSDKAWSFTDCTSKVLLDELRIERAFAFDQHFRQFGGINVVP